MQRTFFWMALLAISLTTACETDDEKVELSGPEITVYENLNIYLPGEKALVTMDIEAPGGIKMVTVGINTITTFANNTSVKGLTAEYTIPEDAVSGIHHVSIFVEDLQSPPKTATSQAVLQVAKVYLCDDFDESATISGEGKFPISDFSSNSSGLFSDILASSANDEGSTGVDNPQGCGKVFKFDKSPDEWEGWNGFKIILKEPFSANDFSSFARTNVTRVLKIDVLRAAKEGSGSFPAAGLPIYINLGNNGKYGDHPAGRSQYLKGTLTKNNEWQTVTFSINTANSNDIDISVADNETDMMEIVPSGGIASDGGLYYFDNMRLEAAAVSPGNAVTICDFHIDEDALTNAGWTKIFEEDFTSDLSQWNLWTSGAYNNEWQHYQPNNLLVEDGLLQITTKTETVTGKKDPYSSENKTFEFTSGRIETKELFSAGASSPKVRISARIRLPKGTGLWPAFWSCGDPWPTQGEIDILEARGQETTKFETNYFYGTTAGTNLVQNATGYIQTDADLSECFHLYEVVWEQEKLTFYLDGQIVEEKTSGGYIDQLFGTSQKIVLNIAIGGDFFGNLNPDMVENGVMYVDYVKVYTSN